MNINEIVSDFQIVGHRIQALSLENDFAYFDPGDEKLCREVNVTYQLSDPFDFDDDKDSIGGAVTLYIDVSVYDEEKSATVHLELEGGFSLNGSRDAEQLRSMLEVNGCAALYSIARGIIAGVTSQMSVNGTSTILIPMINTFELRDSAEEDEMIE